MPSTALLSPRQRDVIVALVALVLLAGPVWVPMLHLDAPSYRYERVAVTVDGSGLAYTNESAVPAGTVLSDEIACSGPSSRACAFERHLSRNHTVLTGIYSTRPGGGTEPYDIGPDRYEYVQIDGVLYEPVTVANQSRVYVVANGTVYEQGMAPPDADPGGEVYRNELALRAASPSEALAAVSRGADHVAGPIRRAANTGVTMAPREIEPPKTPIRAADGAYYRVFRTAQRQPLGQGGTELLLAVVTTVLGLYGLLQLRDRVQITYDATGTGALRETE